MTKATKARLPQWDQKKELDLCCVWERPTCPGHPHAGCPFREPVAAVGAQLLEDRRKDKHGQHWGRQEDTRCTDRISVLLPEWHKNKSQIKKQTSETSGQTGRNRAGLPAVYLRGPSAPAWASSAARHAASWQDGEPAQLTHVQSMHGVRAQGGLMPSCHHLVLNWEVNSSYQILLNYSREIGSSEPASACGFWKVESMLP